MQCSFHYKLGGVAFQFVKNPKPTLCLYVKTCLEPFPTSCLYVKTSLEPFPRLFQSVMHGMTFCLAGGQGSIIPRLIPNHSRKNQ